MLKIGYKKLFALMLSLIMIAYCLPVHILALETEEINVVVEEKALREENVKHFKMPDGSYTAVVYSNPVHRKDSYGAWQDIDNRMNESTVKNKQAYITSDGRTVFSKKINSKDSTIYRLSENGYSIKVSFNNSGIKNTTAKLSNHAAKYVSTIQDDIATQYKKLKSINNNTKISYKNPLKGMTLEYVLSANDVKENIIIEKTQDEYIFSFTYELVGLIASLNDDGSISLIDEATQDGAYIIPTPYMYDADGNTSYEVSYTIENRDNGVYTLTVLASKEWIDDSERKFPVVIDPTITVDAGYKDTYINSADPDVNYGRSNELWISSSKTAFMKYNSLPSIPEYATINRAVLDLNYYYYVTSGSVDVGFYLAYIDWDEYSLTWNKANQNLWLGIIPMQFSTITLPASASITEDTPGLASINVTELVQAWYAGGANCGIALKYEGGSNGSVIIKSWEAGSSTRAKYEISYSTGGIPLSNGTYFFKNGQYDKYMQIDNNASINENGAIIELWEFDGGLDQKWTLEYMHNGYYKISSCASGKVITAPSNVDNSLTQKDYGLSDEQLWKITAIGGMYKFSPKSNSSYYMAAGSGILGSNGRNVEMRASQSDSKDKWALHMQNDYTLMYIGYEPGDTLMPPILNTVKTALTNANKTGYGYTSLNKADLLVHLSSTSIFSCITHGLSTAIATTDDTLTVNNINALDNTAFDSLKFVYLGACLTGEGGSSANNLVNAFYNKGADTVLGFTISVLVGETNSWTKSFMLSLASGSTISKAMTDADTAVRNDATVNVVHYTTSSTYRYIAGSPQIAPCK